ncbi:MAG: DUF1343 domain-containing protein [Leptonema sp. (in: bacteria)]
MKLFSSLDRFIAIKDQIIPKGAKIGLFTNQCSYSFQYKKYSYELIEPNTIFLLEHGFFSELQDQISIQNIENYKRWYSANWISLYGEEFTSLFPKKKNLENLDWIIIDIQDVGSRYYTFLTSVYYLLNVIYKENLDCNLIILDRPNPLIRKYSKRIFEGSPLQKKYQSFVGVEGVLHKHGLTPAELICYSIDRNMNHDSKNEVWIVPFSPRVAIQKKYPKEFILSETKSSNLVLYNAFEIYPSPNMPSYKTAKVYTGQCLLEGTNLSEGRGTTKPFEIFGAPYLSKEILTKISTLSILDQLGVILRELKFIPTSNKYQNQICMGWQMHIIDERKYHSLLTTLFILKNIKQLSNELDWYRGVYEFKSEFLAIEYLLGDEFLFDYLNKNKISFDDLYQYLYKQQNLWKNNIKKYFLYYD